MKLYSARELARAAKLTKRAVLAALGDLTPEGHKEAPGGQKARAWAIVALPEALRAELVKAAGAAKCCSVEELLALTEAAVPPTKERTEELCRVTPDLRKEFNGLADRVLGDDKLSPVNQHWLWHDVLTYWEASPGQRELKRDLLRLLRERFPDLAETPQALRWLFNHKHRCWVKGGRTAEALRDSRENSGRRAAGLCPTCFKLVMDSAVMFDGNETLAFEDLRAKGMLCRSCAGIGLRRAIRRILTPKVEAQLDWRHGQRFALLNGPYISRDWSDVEPGDVFVFDDTTLNHVYCFQDQDGDWNVGRGEFLLGTDAKSDYPLASILINGHYNSGHTRSLVTRAILKVGLPRKGINLEKGVWNSLLMRGPRRPHWEIIDRSQVENGLFDPRLGLRLIQSQVPRAKTIERAIGILQERMRREKGFVGFNERTDRREGMQDYISSVRAGKEDPRNELWTQEEWNLRLSELLQEFAAAPQHGKRLAGKAPVTAWSESVNRSPLRPVTAAECHILATHQRVCHVGPRGVVINIPGHGQVCFANGELGPFRGLDVIAYINWEEPTHIICSDMKKETFFSVESHILPAYSGTREQFAAAGRDFADFKRPAKALFDNIQPLTVTISRDSQVSAETRAEAEAIRTVTERRKAAERALAAKEMERKKRFDLMEARAWAKIERAERERGGL